MMEYSRLLVDMYVRLCRYFVYRFVYV